MCVLLKPNGPGEELNLVDEPKLDLADLAMLAPKVPRVRMAIVGGYHPKGRTLPWTLVGRDGRRTRNPARARFFACSAAGVQAALEAAEALRDRYRPDATVFAARVLVTGEWAEPLDVIEAYLLERGQPVNVGRYSFE